MATKNTSDWPRSDFLDIPPLPAFLPEGRLGAHVQDPVQAEQVASGNDQRDVGADTDPDRRAHDPTRSENGDRRVVDRRRPRERGTGGSRGLAGRADLGDRAGPGAVPGRVLDHAQPIQVQNEGLPAGGFQCY
jgi:hypothetical protein